MYADQLRGHWCREVLFAEWQPHTHGGGCEQAVVRSWQRLKKKRRLATASNIVLAGFFQIGQGLCVQNSYWVLQAAFLLGTSGSILTGYFRQHL